MNALVVHYRTLRQLVGVLAVSLPVVMPLGLVIAGDPHPVRESISAYHATSMGDVLVGLIASVGTFLFAYRGYDDQRVGRWSLDNVMGTIASGFAALLAFCPVEGGPVLHTLHLVGGTGMFSALAYFSLFLFTRGAGDPTPQKRRRNVVYRVNGVLIFVCMAAMGVYWAFFTGTSADALHPVYWLEAVMLVAFGVSWAVKGELVLGDP